MIFGQESGGSPSGLFAGVAYTLTALAGVIAAVTALVKAFRPDKAKKGDDHDEDDDVFRTRVVREAIQNEADALERAYLAEDRVAELEAKLAELRARYIALLEERRPQP